ncbi:MAG: hypothetical protein LBP81_03425, partial [Treponema sp.]|nr:hypothetical protein [Treponema sp.]
GFSQEVGSYPGETDGSRLPLDSNRLLLHTDSFFSKTWYQWGDGTPAPYKDVLAHIAAVPENKSLAQQEKIWRGVTYTTAGLFLASFAGTAVYSIGDFNEPRIFGACLYTRIFSFLFSIAAGDIANIKLQSAVDRYNLSIGLGR